jgi:hypothetical protein
MSQNATAFDMGAEKNFFRLRQTRSGGKKESFVLSNQRFASEGGTKVQSFDLLWGTCVCQLADLARISVGEFMKTS